MIGGYRMDGTEKEAEIKSEKEEERELVS